MCICVGIILFQVFGVKGAEKNKSVEPSTIEKLPKSGRKAFNMECLVVKVHNMAKDLKVSKISSFKKDLKKLVVLMCDKHRRNIRHQDVTNKNDQIDTASFFQNLANTIIDFMGSKETYNPRFDQLLYFMQENMPGILTGRSRLSVHSDPSLMVPLELLLVRNGKQWFDFSTDYMRIDKDTVMSCKCWKKWLLSEVEKYAKMAAWYGYYSVCKKLVKSYIPRKENEDNGEKDTNFFNDLTQIALYKKETGILNMLIEEKKFPKDIGSATFFLPKSYITYEKGGIVNLHKHEEERRTWNPLDNIGPYWEYAQKEQNFLSVQIAALTEKSYKDVIFSNSPTREEFENIIQQNAALYREFAKQLNIQEGNAYKDHAHERTCVACGEGASRPYKIISVPLCAKTCCPLQVKACHDCCQYTSQAVIRDKHSSARCSRGVTCVDLSYLSAVMLENKKPVEEVLTLFGKVLKIEEGKST